MDEGDFGLGMGSTNARGVNQPIPKKTAEWISRSGPDNPPISPSKNGRRKRSNISNDFGKGLTRGANQPILKKDAGWISRSGPDNPPIAQTKGGRRKRSDRPIATLEKLRSQGGLSNNADDNAVGRVEAKAKDGFYEKEVLVDELAGSEKGLDVPQHLAELAVEEPRNNTVASCLEWLWNNHSEELFYGKVQPISSCPHSGQMNVGVLNNAELFDKAIMDGGLSFKCPHDKEQESARDRHQHARFRGQKYLCLECGLVLCSRCEGGDSKEAHRKETGHCLFVGLFDLFVECRECDALFKLPLLEALPKKNAAFAGWCEDVIVDYERTEDSECAAVWVVQ